MEASLIRTKCPQYTYKVVLLYAHAPCIQGPLVYVNYGRLSDFEYLTNSSGPQLNLSSYICIVRYGQIFRGDKVWIEYYINGLYWWQDNLAPQLVFKF